MMIINTKEHHIFIYTVHFKLYSVISAVFTTPTMLHTQYPPNFT